MDLMCRVNTILHKHFISDSIWNTKLDTSNCCEFRFADKQIESTESRVRSFANVVRRSTNTLQCIRLSVTAHQLNAANQSRGTNKHLLPTHAMTRNCS